MFRPLYSVYCVCVNVYYCHRVSTQLQLSSNDDDDDDDNNDNNNNNNKPCCAAPCGCHSSSPNVSSANQDSPRNLWYKMI
jgi:hypothetical protein